MAKKKAALGERGHLLTEQRLAASMNLDRLPIGKAFDVINDEDRKIADAVRKARPAIVRAVRLISDSFQRGGRLIYVGAGTSGRLGVLDAAECPPTFRSPPEMVQAIIAGGPKALIRAVEGAEDDRERGADDVKRMAVTEADVIFGIATGGTTPFVHGALDAGRSRGAGTILLACVSRKHVKADVDVDIRVLTGPEALTGSTRMKAGLATKMVLNSISTLAMVQLGKVYENLMVDRNSCACRKLVDRAARVVATLCELPFADAGRLLNDARGSVKTAIVMHRRGLDRHDAERLIQRNGGHLRRALEAGEV